VVAMSTNLTTDERGHVRGGGLRDQTAALRRQSRQEAYVPTMSRPFAPAEDDDRAEMQRDVGKL
jgi:hypothetical protein